MTLSTKQKQFAKIAGAAFALSALTTSLYAGGFQLYEQDAASLGEYHAGSAAQADDASTEFYNPAGMIRLKHTEVSTGLTSILLRTKFNGTVSLLGGDPVAASGSGNTNNFTPNFHLVVPFAIKGHAAAFGFGITTPFGLSTIYPSSNDDTGNPIGAAATNTTIITMNISPSLAIALNKHFSIGAGIDFMYGKADYDGDLGESEAYYANHLQGTDWGFNAGILWQPSKRTRVGLAYRSKMTIKAHGPSSAAGQPTEIATATLPLPADTTLSVFHQMNHRWSLMASAEYTQWNVFKTLVIKNMVAPLIGPGTTVVNFDYKNSWFGAIGTKFQMNDRNALMFGFGYDQTPTRDGYRDIRLPDGNRLAGSIGWQYRIDCKSTLSLAYAYIDMGGNVKIDNSHGAQGNDPVVKGISKGHAHVIGLQLSYSFA